LYYVDTNARKTQDLHILLGFNAVAIVLSLAG